MSDDRYIDRVRVFGSSTKEIRYALTYADMHDPGWRQRIAPSEAASPRQGEPVGGLDVAWRAAEAVLPEGWRLRVTRTDDDYDVWQASAVSPAFFDGENDNDSDFAHGEGPTPEAALRALVALPTQASDSPEKP